MKKNAEYVGVNDEYIPKNEKYVDESTFTNEKKEKIEKNVKKSGKIVLGLIIGYIAFIVLFVILIFGVSIFEFIQFNKQGEKMMNFFVDKMETMDDDEYDYKENVKNKKKMEKLNNEYEEGEEKVKDFINEIQYNINNN